MKITFAAHALPSKGALVVGVTQGNKLSPSATALDKKSGGAVKRAIAASRFTGRKGEFLELLAPPKLGNSRLLLAGLGEVSKLNTLDLENLGGSVYANLATGGETEVSIIVDDLKRARSEPSARAARYAYGALLRSYRFDKYRTKEKPEKKPSLKRLSVLVENPGAARKVMQDLTKVAEGVFFTRDLVSEPANVIFPESFAERTRSLTALGVKVQALGVATMRRQGMGALLGVGQGSVREPRLVVMQWNGAPAAKGQAAKPIAIVGKGVTFDTGGISIKPAAGMEDMKWDMGGAGVVAGLMKALAGRKAKVNVVGVCGLAENMPDGNAQRPGDIVTSMSGQTIEVLNTDAEGRLVLADALWYTQQRFKPRAVIDLATLTGAIIVALGNEYAGVFSNDDKLAKILSDAGEATGEGVWRMPLGEEYDKLLDTPAADIKNIGGGRAGGSITAAQFLQRFIKDGTAWAHIDIAGVTWASKDKPTVPKGGTAFGVRLLNEMIAAHYEG
jgi:leucyl aminopeptidase